ncbi:MAG TPA: maleylacetoacetate isomerase, partial [Polyangiaceae bacterium]|nr:maleylacetoacetate isomerase [Polyangiaceae bacterium]
MSSIVLHGYWRSSCSYRVRIALGAKGLDYATHPVNLLTGAQLHADYTSVSPTGYVPTLELGGEAFIESMAILELLEELHAEPALLPKTPTERARVRALCEIINAGVQPLQNLNVLRRVSEDAAAQKEWMVHFIGKGLRAFEHRLEQLETHGVRGPFVYGERFGMADCLLVPQVYAARRQGVDLGPMARVVRAAEAAGELAFVKAAHPDKQPDAVL